MKTRPMMFATLTAVLIGCSSGSTDPEGFDTSTWLMPLAVGNSWHYVDPSTNLSPLAPGSAFGSLTNTIIEDSATLPVYMYVWQDDAYHYTADQLCYLGQDQYRDERIIYLVDPETESVSIGTLRLNVHDSLPSRFAQLGVQGISLTDPETGSLFGGAGYEYTFRTVEQLMFKGQAREAFRFEGYAIEDENDSVYVEWYVKGIGLVRHSVVTSGGDTIADYWLDQYQIN